MTAAYSCCSKGYTVNLLADFSLDFLSDWNSEIFSVLRNQLDSSTNEGREIT